MARNLSIISARKEGKGNGTLILEVQLQDPRLSSSGKSHLVASESGVSTVKVAGRDVIINLNAIVPLKTPATLPGMQRTTAELKGKVITLKTPLQDPVPSSSGKSMLVAKDSGFTGIKLGAGQVQVMFSAYFYAEDKKAA